MFTRLQFQLSPLSISRPQDSSIEHMHQNTLSLLPGLPTSSSYNYSEDEDWLEYEIERYYSDNEGEYEEEIYGDCSVKVKAPRPRLGVTVKHSPNIQPYSRNMAPTAPNYPRDPLQFTSITLGHLPPEILYQIFSHADQAALCNISRVSRKFNAVANRYIERQGMWTLGSQEDEDALLDKMRAGLISVLSIKYPTEQTQTQGRLEPFNTWTWAWQRFVGLITEPCLLYPVKKMIIDCPNMWNLTALPSLLPFMQFVHTLALKIGYNSVDIPLLPILDSCPCLDTLAIEQGLNVYWHAVSAVSSGKWSTFRLSRFSVSGARFTSSTIEELLGACPHLISFSAVAVSIHAEGTTPITPLPSGTSLPIEPFYRRAAFLCPKLVEFSLTPRLPSNFDSFDHQLALTMALFPHAKHVDVGLPIPNDWIPTPEISEFLGQLTSIDFRQNGRDLGRVLRHARSLTNLWAPMVTYQRPQSHPLNVQERVEAAMATIITNQDAIASAASKPKQHWTPMSKIRLQKLQHRLEKKFIREEQCSQRRLNMSSSWNCRLLRTLALNIGGGREAQTRMFHFLVRTCPGLVELKLSLDYLEIGKETPDVSKHYSNWLRYITIYYRSGLRRHGRVYSGQRAKQLLESPLLALGRLERLESLYLTATRSTTKMCTHDFEFLRPDESTHGEGSRGLTFCPRLQSLAIRSHMTYVTYGTVIGKPCVSKQQFLNILKSMRPEIQFSF